MGKALLKIITSNQFSIYPKPVKSETNLSEAMTKVIIEIVNVKIRHLQTGIWYQSSK